jgi:hypothetical protein
VKSRSKPGKAPTRRKRPVIPIVFVVAAVAAFGAWKFSKRESGVGGAGAPAAGGAATASAVNDDAVVGALVAAEETYLALAPKLNALSRGVMSLQLPPQGIEVFAPDASVTDLGAAPDMKAAEALVT